ncbi:MAG: EpsI family protein [Proteobacteria bacterium]|nr:EpsI family protein [Pseudomonadota bacterium]
MSRANPSLWQNAALAVLIGAVGLLAWRLELRPALQVEPAPLGRIPLQIQAWEGRDLPVADDVSALLRADWNLQREYRDPLGNRIWLYLGYYGTERGGRPEHTPWACYPSAGWQIVADRTTESGHANELLLRREGHYRLVHFWFRSSRRTGLLGSVDQFVDRVWNRLRHGRADGALVRLSTPLPDPARLEAHRARLHAFAEELDPQLAEHWPLEQVEGHKAPAG